jgi:nucleoside diphosphate kinase/adenylate kinase family enzyme
MSVSYEQIVFVVNAEGVLNGRVEPNIEVLTEAGFLVCEKVKRVLGPGEADFFVSDEKERQLFTSAPVCVLLLKREEALVVMGQISDDLDDFYHSATPYLSIRDQAFFFPTTPRLERAPVVIKPGYKEQEFASIKATLEKNDFVIVCMEYKMINEEDARVVFSDSKEEIAHVTHHVCVKLVVEKLNAVEELLILAGPTDPDEARATAPNSLRAQLGKNRVENAVYCSPSVEKAAKDIAVLFRSPFVIERTLALVKPDAIAHLDEVRAVLKLHQFTVIIEEELCISKHRAEELYAAEKSKSWFDSLTQFMSSGPVVALVLAKPGAVKAWQSVIGAANPRDARLINTASLRARFGTNDIVNGFHGSETVEKAADEIDMFFPQLRSSTVPSIVEVENAMRLKPDSRPGVDSKSLHDVLVEGLTHLCHVKPQGGKAVTYLANWLLQNNPNKPSVVQPEEDMTATVSFRDEIVGKLGGAPTIVWSIAAPGSVGEQQNGLYQRIGADYGYEVINTLDLIQSAQQSGSAFGRTINEFVKLGRPLPTHIVVGLVKDAIAGNTQSSILLTGFPSNLDMAFNFEEEVGAVSSILFLEGSDSRFLAEAKEHGKSATQSAMTQLADFNLSIFPVVEHYRTFGKVLSVSGIGDLARVYGRIQKVFS